MEAVASAVLELVQTEAVVVQAAAYSTWVLSLEALWGLIAVVEFVAWLAIRQETISVAAARQKGPRLQGAEYA